MLNELRRELTPRAAAKLGMPLERVRKALKLAREPLSMEAGRG
jgi:hypothetical protein